MQGFSDMTGTLDKAENSNMKMRGEKKLDRRKVNTNY
jgi:hypothetical protein